MTRLKPRLNGDDEERAVSPVIGVILMVAITVILAAVVAGVMMGFTDGIGNTAPTTSVEVTADSDWDPSGTDSGQDVAYLSHVSGDVLQFDDMRIVLRNDDGASLASLEHDGTDTFEDSPASDITIDTSNINSFSGGTTLTITADEGSTLNENELTIQVFHMPSDSMVSESTLTF